MKPVSRKVTSDAGEALLDRLYGVKVGSYYSKGTGQFVMGHELRRTVRVFGMNFMGKDGSPEVCCSFDSEQFEIERIPLNQFREEYEQVLVEDEETACTR